MVQPFFPKSSNCEVEEEVTNETEGDITDVQFENVQFEDVQFEDVEVIDVQDPSTTWDSGDLE